MKLLIVYLVVLTMFAVSAYAAPVTLGTAGNFALLAASAITNTGNSVIYGDVGSSPTTAVTGFPPGIVNGTLYTAANAATGQAQLDLLAAYNTAASAAPTLVLTGTDLGFYNSLNPLSPGVYFFSSSAQLTGNLTLKGNGDPNAQWIFQIGSTLTTGSNSSVSQIDGATKCQVFWQVGSSATLGTGTDFIGNIMADQSITLNGGNLYGRALAKNAAITISSAETVDARRCNAPAPEVPEPSSIVLAMTAIPAVLFFRRRK